MVQRSLEWPLLVLGRLGDQPLQILTLGWVADDANMISAEGVGSFTCDRSWLEWPLRKFDRTIEPNFPVCLRPENSLAPKFVVVFDTEFARWILHVRLLGRFGKFEPLDPIFLLDFVGVKFPPVLSPLHFRFVLIAASPFSFNPILRRYLQSWSLKSQ